MIRKFLLSLLVDHANNGLNIFKRWILSIWLRCDSNAREQYKAIHHLQEGMSIPANIMPSKNIWKRIETEIALKEAASSPRSKASGFWSVWVSGMSLILFSFILLWYVLPPGIILQWSVAASEPRLFRIYRANPAASDSFELLNEISSKEPVMSSESNVYTYRDVFLLPGQEYVYRIEMVDQNGLVTSQTILSKAMEALPGQAALFLSFLIFCYAISLAIRKPKNLYLPVNHYSAT